MMLSWRPSTLHVITKIGPGSNRILSQFLCTYHWAHSIMYLSVRYSKIKYHITNKLNDLFHKQKYCNKDDINILHNFIYILQILTIFKVRSSWEKHVLAVFIFHIIVFTEPRQKKSRVYFWMKYLKTLSVELIILSY